MQALLAQVIEISGALADAALALTPPDGLILTPAHRRALEAITGIGTAQTPESLVRAVERLAAIEVGEIRIDFTPGQLEEIRYRAGKRGRTIAEELKAVVDRIQDELFHRGA